MADDLTDEQVKAYRLADNKVAEFSDWDDNLLSEELDSIFDIDMSAFGFDIDAPVDGYLEDKRLGSLVDKFGVPPFSILDTRQKYWQDRKKEWLALGLESGKGRRDDLLGKGLKSLDEKLNLKITGTSIFDPVLCEIAYKWFCPENGKVIDPFAGGSVRGVVAEKLGLHYIGIDLSMEQIEENYANAKEMDVTPLWICDDSKNIDAYAKDEEFDMIMSCPPYADLEVYSDDPRDISNMSYGDFLSAYREIIAKTVTKLRYNRFAVWTIGEVRDKKGFYRGFLEDTKQAFKDAGMQLYNEMILVEMLGTAPVRAPKIFNSSRKVTKTHQNVLVFYKGDPKDIKNFFKEIDFPENDLDEPSTFFEE